MPIVPLFLLTGCFGSIGSVEPPVLDGPPPSLIEKCERPILLPEHELSQVQVERFWLADRSNLVTCGERLEAIVGFYQNRDAEIMGADK